MATQFEIDCALMAGRVYESTRTQENWLPTPDGWTEFFHRPNNGQVITSGFEASAFQSSSNPNNIVISYAGTYPSDTSLTGDWANNLALGFLGKLSAQMIQAADYYMDVKAANPNAQIIFTGHSLGGGLASLMAVFFNQPAITFNQAPFRNAANLEVATELRDHLLSKYPNAPATLLAPLDGFINSFDSVIGGSNNGLEARSSNVTNTNVMDETLSQPLNALIPLVEGLEVAPFSWTECFMF